MATRLSEILGLAPGIILPTAGILAGDPVGWLVCDGRAVSRTTYAALFAMIGTSFGPGNGSTTFNIPDGRGRTLIGVGAGAGLTARALGDTVGTETHTLTVAQMPTHGHRFRASYTNQASPQTQNTGGFMTTTASDATQAEFTGTPSAAQGQQIGGTGGDGAHPNMQPSLAVNWLIKT